MWQSGKVAKWQTNLARVWCAREACTVFRAKARQALPECLAWVVLTPGTIWRKAFPRSKGGIGARCARHRREVRRRREACEASEQGLEVISSPPKLGGEPIGGVV